MQELSNLGLFDIVTAGAFFGCMLAASVLWAWGKIRELKDDRDFNAKTAAAFCLPLFYIAYLIWRYLPFP